VFGGHDITAAPALHRDEISAIINSFSDIGVCYRGVEGSGWLPPSCNGAELGRRSDDLQLFHLWSARFGLTICYQAFSAGIGWLAENCAGNVTGVRGHTIQALRLRVAASHGERLFARAFLDGAGWQTDTDVTDGGQIGIIGRAIRQVVVFLR
jgi:hypothetical protein